jgi:cell cycle sensor histidine kinase DivJ
VSFLTPVWSYIDALVHPSARVDALTAARHRAFIAPRLLGSFAVLSALPIYLALRGMPNVLEAAVFCWLLVPIAISYFLSCTGQLERAQILSTLSILALAMLSAWWTGGIESRATIWLAIVPLEAALSGSRRAITAALALTFGCTVLLLAASSASLLPQPPIDAADGVTAAFVVVFAALLTTGIALGSGSLLRMSSGLLSAEADRFRLLARHMSDVITRHGRNGVVTYVSPAAESLFGVSPHELLGHRLFDRVHVADRPTFLTALSDAATGAERSVEFRIRPESRDAHGGFAWIEMRCRPVDDNADDNGVVAVLRDISERKLTEQALQIARADAERANAGKTRFLATMSHELRTPLNAIIGFSDMLGNEQLNLEPSRRLEYARLINDSGRHLLSLVNGVLDMSKLETDNFDIAPESFAPATAISNCCDILAMKAHECGVELKTRIADDLPEIVADRRAVSQILINLISNAIKFTPRGGHVMVSASCEAENLVLGVQDTGVGINEADLPRIGEAFFQARDSYDRRHDGVGLGLSIVKGLVRLHHGDIDIRSHPGDGTRVTVRLPLEHKKRGIETPIAFVGNNRHSKGRIVSNLQVRKSA